MAKKKRKQAPKGQDIFSLRMEDALQELAGEIGYKEIQIDNGYRRIRVIARDGHHEGVLGEHYHAIWDEQNQNYIIIYSDDINLTGKTIPLNCAEIITKIIVSYSVTNLNTNEKDFYVKRFDFTENEIIDMRKRITKILQKESEMMNENYRIISITEDITHYPDFKHFEEVNQPRNYCDKYFKKYVINGENDSEFLSV